VNDGCPPDQYALDYDNILKNNYLELYGNHHFEATELNVNGHYIDQPGNQLPDTVLLATRFSVPRLRASFVPRSRLTTRLNQATGHKLTLISAPAGSGKTTILSEWIADNTNMRSVAWLSLDEGDNDLIRFWRYCITALRKFEPHLGETALTWLHSVQPPAIEAVLIALLNDIVVLPHRIILVLDDYHVIVSPTIHRSLAFLLDHLPEHMHVIMTCRSDPPLSLPRLRARGELVEIRTPDLRFTFDEAITFLEQVMHVQLTREDIAILEERTEGWVTGLQLAGLFLQGRRDAADFVRSFSGTNRYVLDYLLEEVLHRQPGHIQTFLLETAILNRLTGPLCNVICDRNDGQEMLETLERANLFLIPLDTTRRWYRYHHLFADLLRHRLQLDAPERLADLHQRAAQWYESHGMIVDAIGHALVAQNFVYSVCLINEVAETMLMRGEAMTVVNWLKRLPTSLLHTQPELSFAYALALLALSQFDAVEPYLQYAERALIHHHEEHLEPSLPESETQYMKGRIAAARSTVAANLGDYQHAIELSHLALSTLPEQDVLARGMVTMNLGDSYVAVDDLKSAEQAFTESIALNQQSNSYLVSITTICSLGKLYEIRGQLHKAVTLYQQALHLANSLSRQEGLIVPSAGKAYIFLGNVLLEWNDLDTAFSHAMQGIELCKQWQHLYHLIEGYLLLLHVQLSRGNTEEALVAFAEIEHLVKDATMVQPKDQQAIPDYKRARLVDYVGATRAQLWLARGDLDSVARWVHERGLNIDDHSLSFFRGYVVLARLLLAQQKYDQAAKLSGRLLALVEQKGWLWGALEVLILQALALNGQGNTTAALHILIRALSLAEPEGYVRTFIDRGTSITWLLQQATSHDLVGNYARALLQACGDDVIPASSSTLVSPLSEREREVLRLLAAGMSNREIAETLVLTVGTVKWYVNSIYGKLAVRSRTQAVAQARVLGLLPS
jgi:LuxR family maltose regulon positive regulatory protein